MALPAWHPLLGIMGGLPPDRELGHEARMHPMREGGMGMSGQETGWAAQQMVLPVSWYDTVATGSGAEFPVSGDQTARADAAARIGKKLGIDLTPWQEQVLNVQMLRHADIPTIPNILDLGR
ncbi:hypothetical protein HOU96_gp55 [Arthrobacter phage Maja]|uniref:Uncharacterized protein n=1 Tax=Arthrobacter phage Maja TaxID=2499009 RepID=A0A3S9UNJ5_9CAUD|nr:hypothetical protein HOU96_gp55 [Arthrobacter phage Maja]AZS11752.1 hypothetical protein PBI_MAJA_55 [Arthrobacter phage Maja]